MFLYSSSLEIVNDPQNLPSSSVSMTTSRPTDSTTTSINTSVGQTDGPSSNFSEKHSLDKEPFWDSDFEYDDTPDWRQKMNQDELKRLRPKQQKRQDVINGECRSL